jgi:hypothetical protein
VHFTPTSASWLNVVERWFATLTEKQIKRGAHRSTRALETAIREYLTITNASAKPFVWTKPPTKFSRRSPDFVSESLTRDTNGLGCVGPRRRGPVQLSLATPQGGHTVSVLF